MSESRSIEALLERRKTAARAVRGPWGVSVTNRTALFQLNPRWTEAPTAERLRRAAYHEFLEVLLSPLRVLAFDTEAHAIIRRLEYLTYGPSDAGPKASA